MNYITWDQLESGYNQILTDFVCYVKLVYKGAYKEAEQLRKEFKVPDKRSVHLYIHRATFTSGWLCLLLMSIL